ncbi:WD40-repeat-containing domain protein [Stachybotrys elegans]|uniref:Mitochondrial division protein 1 n=1 Tax=Stachybotrys elegans TaxID=80388 RepID=A0A8K0SCY0_9HYPO|nr:WD40-repeat-containing domain protein [Stachybotrys elegans]
MRLVNVETLKLEDFLDDRAPPYAILSHTWGDDSEELTIRDVEEGKIDKPGAGALKFRGCCQQARNDNLRYVWIDTCCINKTDLVELSEAINSMFRWYSRASVCYAYLSDVPGPGDQNPREEGSKFRESRWFRRGWTLQELLAPRRLVFYSLGWTPLGTKVRLCAVIESITGIPRLVLKGVDGLESASVSQRMSWAAQRHTKRKEDLAYCLLGIFGIAMPMIYGEGGDQAFFRLQEQIMRSTTGRDHSILAWGLGNELGSGSRGVLAAAPSDFANSRHIIPRDQSHFDSLDISSGSLRISLPLLATPSGTIGLLNCGPEGDAKQAVGIPLIRVASGESDEYLRPRGRCSALWSIPASIPLRQSIYIKTDSGANSQSSNQYFDYNDDDFADADLELIEVVPQSCWDRDQAIIISTIESNPTLIRLRHNTDKVVSRDFVLIIEFKQQGPSIEACHCVTICSRDTSLESFTEQFDHVIKNASGKRSASNGLTNLQVAINPIARRPMFTIRPEAIPRPPDVTFDATARIQKSHVALAIEALLHGQGLWKELQYLIDYSDQSCDIRSISGQPPLTWASENGNTEVAKLLLDDRVDSAATRSGQRAPLIAASDKGHADVVRLLLNTDKIDIDVQDEGGRTPLSLAADRGHNIIVQLLLEKGADVDVEDKARRTALSYAAERGHKAIAQLLFRSGAATSREFTAWRLRRTLEGHEDSVWSVAFSHDSKLLASSSKDQTIRLWDTATGETLQTLKGHRGGVRSVDFSHNSELLASASWEGHSIRIWNVTTGRLQKTLKGHTDNICSVNFSHDSKLLASASMDHTVKIWDTTTGQSRHNLQGHKGGVWSVAFSRDSKLLASASMDHTVRVWDTATGRLHQTLWGHKDDVWTVTFSHNRKQLASASMDYSVRLWDVVTGKLHRNLWGHRGEVWSITFSHNSKLLVSASMDHSIRIWDTATGRLHHTLWDHRDAVWSVSFSNDSKVLASASKDGTVRIWNTATGQLLQTLWGHKDAVRLVAFSYDSKLLASASVDNTIRLWESS